MHISGAHNSAVTCLEWSPDGELLYSGDKQGKIYVTVIKIQEVNHYRTLYIPLALAFIIADISIIIQYIFF